jgi:hypothetical protein
MNSFKKPLVFIFLAFIAVIASELGGVLRKSFSIQYANSSSTTDQGMQGGYSMAASYNASDEGMDGSVKSFYEACKIVNRIENSNPEFSSLSKDDIYQSSYCLGFIHSNMGILLVIASDTDVECKNEIGSINQSRLISTFLSFVDDNPNILDLPGGLIMHLAFTSKYPCVEKVQ